MSKIAIFIFLLLVSGSGWALDAPLSPAQVAYVKAETRKADEQFIQSVARIAGAPEQTVRDAMPTEGRITDPAARVIAVLEKARKQALSDQQKNQISAAEQERRRAIAEARERAKQH